MFCPSKAGMGLADETGDDDMTTIKTIAELFANLPAIRQDIKRMGAQSFEFNLDCGKVVVTESEVKSI